MITSYRQLTSVERFKKLQVKREQLLSDIKFANTQLVEAQNQAEKLMIEQQKILNSLQAIKDAKPILSAQSIEQCEKLANSALETIFETDAKVKYSAEEQRFVLDKGDFDTDLVAGNGGGYLAVISFIFNLFLLMKMKRRRLMIFDEQFTQISDAYIGRFYEFVRKICQELNIDCLAVTHDVRVEDDMVDHVYLLEDGKTIKIK